MEKASEASAAKYGYPRLGHMATLDIRRRLLKAGLAAHEAREALGRDGVNVDLVVRDLDRAIGILGELSSLTFLPPE